MHCMHRGLSTKKLSVCASVRLSNAWIMTKRKEDLSRFLYHAEDHLAWEEEWFVGATPSTWNFGSSWSCWSEIADFQSTFARSASAVAPNKKFTRTPKSFYITPVLKFLHWLNTNERIKYKLLSLTYKVITTNQPQYLHYLISVQPYYNTRSLSMVTLLVHLPGPLWKSLIAIFGMLHLVYGTNSPLMFASLVRHSLLHFHLSHMAVYHNHQLHYHRLHLLLLVQYFILNSRLGSSAQLMKPWLKSFQLRITSYRTSLSIFLSVLTGNRFCENFL